MALVVPGVARFSVRQSMGGREVVNVLDYLIDTTGSTQSRNDAIDAQAGGIIDQWVQQILAVTADDLLLNSVDYVDLDSATGVTGSRVATALTSLPDSGASTAAPMPGNVAVMATKQVPSARGRRNGRMFLCGVTEGRTPVTDPNVMDSTGVNAYQNALDTFLANTNELDTLGTAHSSNMVVVHVTARDAAGNPTQGESSVVDQLVVDNRLATQRRRLRG